MLITLFVALVTSGGLAGNFHEDDRAVLNGSPLSTGRPPLEAEEHPLKPKQVWLSTAAPLPTNEWWQNLVLGTGQQPVNCLPYTIRADTDGLHSCRPTPRVTKKFITTAFKDDLVLGAREDLGTRKVVSYDALSVTLEWTSQEGSLTSPLVRGMPYVTAEYDGLTPELRTCHAILEVNGSSVEPGSRMRGDRFILTMNDGRSWVAYTSQPVTLEAVTDSHLVATEPLVGHIRVACLDGANIEVLDGHASRVPVGGVVQDRILGHRAELRFEWSCRGEGELLMMALPHHLDIMNSQDLTPHHAWSLRGGMRGVRGDRWVLDEVLTRTGWGAKRPVRESWAPAIRTALEGDLDRKVEARDTYFAGKELAALGRLALIADELGEAETADRFRESLQEELNPWLEGRNPTPLVHDQTWGGIVSSSAIKDSRVGFGQGFYNDHHFHYGYFIYAAAALARGRPEWIATHGDMVNHLVCDIANPSSQDPFYPVLRHMDWFVGHSWASGLFELGDSRNQESTSEAVNAWYAVYLWGLAIENERIRDLGRLLLATEIRSARRYWQITADSDIYPEPFAANRVVGILWSMKVEYATFFGNAPELIHGIQMLPFTPISEELLSRSWIREGYTVHSSKLDLAAESWRGFAYMALAVNDPEEAWDQVQQLDSFDGGNSRANALYWVATRPDE